MNLVQATEEYRKEYNHFVAMQPSGSFLQSWEWGQWQEELGRKAFRYFIAGSDNDHRKAAGAVQLIKMPLPTGKYYLYAPYGPVGNLRFKIGDLRPALQELRRKFPEAIFFRFEPKSGICNLESAIPTAHIQPNKTLILDLTKSKDQLLKEMRPKTRYNIRLAQRHGVQVKADLAVTPGHGLYLRESLELILQTSRRQKFKTFPESYYQNFLNFFGIRNGQSAVKVYVYKALYNKDLLAAAIMVDFGRVRTYLFGGSSSSRREVMAPHLLHYQALVDAKAAGLERYDFWGLDTAREKDPGFARFKLGFGGQVLQYPGAYDIVQRKLQYGMYEFFRKVNRAVH
ncbi:MAG: peptidoglycan bridge formation glycyltransferase FemA/FemB family protein [Patescibacteria group bacterium]|nr:peptidoglycan bridge formation glycyltransferase FemA/FemB family protein [Patescibacteria group bacterium]